MDLEVQELSELLGVSQSLLLQWVQEGKIPAYQLKESVRFNRAEIEDWVLKQQNLKEKNSILNEFDDSEILLPSSKKGGPERFSLFRAIHKGDVFLDIDASSKLSAITQTMERLAPKLQLDSEILTDLIIERENLMPCALGHGYAIPHARDFLLNSHSDIVAVVFLKKPIDYGALDGIPVHTLFFLLACDDKRHLSLLSKIAHLVNSFTHRDILATHPSKDKLLEIIKNWEAQLPS